MACANRMHSSVFTTPAPILGRWCRPLFITTIIAIAEAIQKLWRCGGVLTEPGI